jgi:8-oxo-dGTP pyrophosphatase MutT (NUDIX family)
VWWILIHGSERTRVLIVCGGEILLVLPTLGMSKWSLPGGGIKAGEDPAEAACREVYEELGLRLTADSLQLLAIEPAQEDSGLGYTCHYYAAVLAERPDLYLALEVVDARWIAGADVRTITAQKLTKRALALWEAR